MNQGVVLWKSGKLPDAVKWMRMARERVPDNVRVLFNAVQISISHMQQEGYDEELDAEARMVLEHVDKLQPGQQRFAQLMEQLRGLQPQADPAAPPVPVDVADQKEGVADVAPEPAPVARPTHSNRFS